MNTERARTSSEIFTELHRELRAWNNKVPEAPERMDPILRTLLQIYAHQLAEIDNRVGQTWQVATTALLKAVAPESRRWPVPAFTVMRCLPRDPVVEVDPFTRFFYRERREGGQTFFFSPPRKEKLLAAKAKHIYYVENGIATDLTSSSEARGPIKPVASAVQQGPAQIFIGVEFTGAVSAFKQATIFIKGIKEALKQFRWAYWTPGSSAGYVEEARFCPGLTVSVTDLFSATGRELDWGGLRKTADLFAALEDNFVMLPDDFVARWEASPLGEQLSGLLSRSRVTPPERNAKLYWIRLDLPTGGDRQALRTSIQIYFDAFIALNKNELKLFKHTGGNRLVEVELPEEINSILDVTQVVDSNGREYHPQHELPAQRATDHYSIEERDNHLVLWFDFFSATEEPPESLSVVYTVTAGTAANGIEAGKVNELYESHPGLQSAENIVPVMGAIPARTDAQIVSEVGARLRNRDRVLSFPEISNWVMTFDPRIQKARCENGVERGERGVHRCIVVRALFPAQEVYSQDEVELLRSRLHGFLKSRAPVNTQFKVEIQTV
ncbi:MAG TPA: hypothetical protein VMS71_06275 [Candidatus Acidoferrum sp.]|nr:hypothetical protein [Candidatus Acidoferrum sp.]